MAARIIRAIDCETLGLDAADGVCQVGWCDVELSDAGVAAVGMPHEMFVNAYKPIPAVASAIHHIVDADVVAAPSLADAIAVMMTPSPDIVCAHVASFERKFLTLTAPWICTYKVAVAIAPNAPDHKLQTLRYWSKLQVDSTLAAPPHRAGPDAYVCAHLLARMLAKMNLASMIEVSAKPVLLPRLTFGEHAMKPAADVPRSYYDWIVNKSKGPWDEDVMHTAKHYLNVI